MIIWLNGAFGAGKTQTAYELHRRLPGSFVYDPEEAGFFIRRCMPQALSKPDFQDYPMWRACNYEMLAYMAAAYEGVILVPMTVTNHDYYHEMIGRLGETGTVWHFILSAERETLRRRLRSRLEGRNSWAARQIDRCLAAFAAEIPGISIKTDDLTVAQTAEEIARRAGLSLRPGRRGRLRRTLTRLAVQMRHIR